MDGSIAPSVFQSSPSPGAGRCAVWTFCSRLGRFCFNPRPARGPGAASQCGVCPLRIGNSFQSSPSPGAGRCPIAQGGSVWHGATVSILAQPGGRALRFFWSFCPTNNVSILAQPGGRALLLAGVFAVQFAGVSILAQPGGRALLNATLALLSIVFLFQSSPSPGAGRCFRCFAKLSPNGCFNPRPARGPGAAQ